MTTTDAPVGQQTVLISRWALYEGGPAQDLDALPTITITEVATGHVVLAATSVGVVHLGLGTYDYPWTPATNLAYGSYQVTWAGLAATVPVPAIEMITVSPVGDRLASPQDVTWLLGDGVDINQAILLIECATGAIQAVTGQRIVQVVDDVQVLDLDGYDCGQYVVLPERPVTAVGAVLIGTTSIVDFVAQLSRSRLWRAYGWRSTLIRYMDQPSTVTVTYTHGYPVGDQKLQLARGTVLSMIRGVADNPTGAVSEKIDDYAVTYAAMKSFLDASPELVALLRKAYGKPVGSVRLIAH